MHASSHATLATQSHPGPFRFRVAIILTERGISYGNLLPAIGIAVERSSRDFGIKFEAVPYRYTVNSVMLCNEIIGLRQVVRALNDSVDMILGPACTAELVAAAKLTTIYQVPIMTGAGSFVDNRDEWPYTRRTAFNTGTMSLFFGLLLRRHD